MKMIAQCSPSENGARGFALGLVWSRGPWLTLMIWRRVFDFGLTR